ncbi:MAG TPA: chorismate mutase, partial [Candidatus Dormibacteraeota bacterium]
MPVRGIRGATTAARNSSEAIVEATTELLVELARLNELDRDEVCFAYFTTTLDLDAEFPALAARRMGWTTVPLLCGNDMVVPGPNPRSVPMCIRILLLYNTDKAQSEMKSAYLRGAQAIRADLDRTAG